MYIHTDTVAGEGARLVRGDARKQSDLDAAGEKKERQVQTKSQGEEVAKMALEVACAEAWVKMCTDNCTRIFARPHAYSKHVAECRDKKACKDSRKKLPHCEVRQNLCGM